MAKTRILSDANQAVARCVPAERTFKPPRGKTARREICIVEVVALDSADDMIELRITENETIRFERERFMQALAIAERRE
ncbi:MAG: hypothetical protein JNG85_14715 [Spirochaetaceae bacterium]|nr:hypothetical protein [Spirochaetaceae bacterium]